ncbi:FAD/NAD(P)-binding domain-containing protein [Apiospora arundinis]
MLSSATKVRVAVVGTGMAGLATGYLLQQDKLQRYSVTLFERVCLSVPLSSGAGANCGRKGDCVSLDAASVTLVDEHDGTYSRVDLPMRAFAGGFYRNLIAMYDHLGIHYHAKRFLYAFSNTACQSTQNDEEAPSSSVPPYFIHSSNNHRIFPIRPAGTDIAAHFLETAYVLACYIWFLLCCVLWIPHRSEDCGTYLKRTKVPHHFVHIYLVPLMSSVATCSHEELLAFPASDLTRYLWPRFGAGHFVVSHGVRDVVAALSLGQDIRLNSEVLLVEPSGSRMRLVWSKGEGANQVEEAIFDRIVLAIDPHAVAKIYAPLRSIMSRIPTRRVESAVLQREGEFTTLRVAKHPYEFNKIDTAGLDAQVADTLLLKSDFSGSGYTEALHTVSCGAIVATSMSGQFDEFKVLHRAAFWRVLRTPKSREIVNTLMCKRLARPEKDQIDSYRKYVEWHNGENNVWLAGGWCWDGMVLLEGCIVSAIQVAQDFGVRIPWDCDLVD